MVYVIICLIAIIMCLRMLAPSRYAVHASQNKSLLEGLKVVRPWLMAGFVRDEKDNHVDIAGKFVGYVFGRSMEKYGIPEGATIIADRLKEDEKCLLRRGDIVVIDGEPEYSKTSLELRVIDEITPAGVATFMDDGLGRKCHPRDVKEIVSLLTHVVESRDQP